MKKKLLAITIGQAPRNDMMDQMGKYLSSFEVIQKGALDGLDKEYIEENLYPEKGDYILESKLLSGEHVNFSEEKIIQLIQDILNEYENDVDQVLMLCTGVFNYKFETKHNIIYPQKLILPVIKALIGEGKLVVLSPNEKQLKQSKEKWKELVKEVYCSFVSPYANNEQEFEDAVKFINETNPDLVLLDCMGYTEQMREYFVRKTEKPVVLSNVLVGKILSEL